MQPRAGQTIKLPADLARRVDAAPPVIPAQVHQWLRYVHGSRAGYLEIGCQDLHGEFFSTWFRYPAELGSAVRHAARMAPTHEVWFGALLKREPVRGTEMPGRMAWCDNDRKRSLDKATEDISALGAAVVRSGTPGNRQVWLALDAPISPDDIRRVNKYLIAQIGGDPKHSPDSLMRMPGTLNHKSCKPAAHACRPVELERRHTRRIKLASVPLPGPERPTGALEMPAPAPLPDPLPARLRAAQRDRGGDRSSHTQRVAYAAAQAGLTDGQILTALEQDLVTQARRAEGRRQQPNWWPSEFNRVLVQARTKYPVPQRDLSRLLDHMRQYADIEDPAYVYTSLAAAAGAETDAEPLWLMLVGPSSSGKTDAINMLSEIAYSMDIVTEAGLLSWGTPEEKGGSPVPVGLLPAIGNDCHGLVTIADLSTLLEYDRRNNHQDVLSAMRRIYDGSYTRSIGAPGAAIPDGPLEWHGRITVVSACTHAIDHFSNMAAALGPRWLYCRLPVRNGLESVDRMARMAAQRGDLKEFKAEARRMASAIVADAATAIKDTETTEDMQDAITHSATIACWGRAHVHRHPYGDRSMSGLDDREEPARLVHQLSMLARGLMALGLPDAYVIATLRRCALDSMPRVRSRVLHALARAGNPATTYRMAQLAQLDRRTVRRQLEELEMIGLVSGFRDGDDKDAPEAEDQLERRTIYWELAGPMGDRARQVIQAAMGDGYYT